MSKMAALSPSLSYDAINAHHQRLRKVFGKHLMDCQEIKPEPASVNRWHTKKLNDVDFFVWDSSNTHGMRSNSVQKTPVARAIKVHPSWNGESIWVGWKESWHRQPNDKLYGFAGASFTFLYGRELEIGTSDCQLLRAEWSYGSQSNNQAVRTPPAHPHWHIDLYPLSFRQVSRLHLGMAGWDRGTWDNRSQCWQYFIGDEISVLETWCERTIEYSIEQIVHYL